MDVASHSDRRSSNGGQTSLHPSNLRNIDGMIYFAGNFSTNGLGNYEPCISRGTAATTGLLKDIHPGSQSESDPTEFTKAGPYVFFAATESVNGRELWRTDGTAAGTVLVKKIWPGPGTSLRGFVRAQTIPGFRMPRPR